MRIYHNPRCSKSREAVAWLKEKNIDFTEVQYIKEGLSTDEILDLKEQTGVTGLIELVRTNEKIWKENYAGKKHTEKQLANIIAENPSLLQRPVVIKDNKAVVARPLSELEKFMDASG